MSAERGNSIGGDLLGAELLASRELAEGAGSIWDAMERGGRIQRQQLEWLVKDYSGFFQDLSKRMSPLALPGATARLMEARLRHIGAGWAATDQLIRDELTPFCNAWQSFGQVVRQDRHR